MRSGLRVVRNLSADEVTLSLGTLVARVAEELALAEVAEQ